MNNIQIINDPQLGEIIFRRNLNAKNYIIRLQNGKVKVTIPLHGNYTRAKEFLSENKQKVLQKIQLHAKQALSDIDETALMQKAQIVLPVQLAKLAALHGFKYSGVKINKSRSRWGSCSSKGIINLSFHLLLLPDYLIEYVLLHELCHTIQLNHSPAFWTLLNKYTHNKALEHRRELKKYIKY